MPTRELSFCAEHFAISLAECVAFLLVDEIKPQLIVV